MTGGEGTILYVNPAFGRITGYDQAEAVGQHTWFLRSGQHREGSTVQDAAFCEELWATIAAGGVWRGRLVNKRKDGTLYTTDATISPVRDENGATVNYVAIQRDVTRELQLEAQYLQAQKLEAVGRLTAGIAHDFNNLLTAVNGFAELLLVHLPPGQPAWDFAEKIYDAGRHAADLVAQLLAFSRQQALERQVLDLNGVVTGMSAMLRRIIGEDVELKTILSPGLWPVLADRSQVEQIVANLAVNARDAMPEGGRLTLETRNVAGAAAPPDLEAGEYVLLAVKDTGVGMSDEVKMHLFEPFFTTKGLGKGTGLGLATVHGIVEQSGGQVRVDSQAGQGAVFRIYLPRFPAPVEPEAEPAGELADLPDGEETILLVEDDERVRDVIRRMLEERGYRVLEAADASEALSAAAAYNGSIHLLLTDLVLPGMSGGVLAERLGRERSGLRVPSCRAMPGRTCCGGMGWVSQGRLCCASRLAQRGCCSRYVRCWVMAVRGGPSNLLTMSYPTPSNRSATSYRRPIHSLAMSYPPYKVPFFGDGPSRRNDCPPEMLYGRPINLIVMFYTSPASRAWAYLSSRHSLSTA